MENVQEELGIMNQLLPHILGAVISEVGNAETRLVSFIQVDLGTMGLLNTLNEINIKYTKVRVI
jgi:hypothetical protein